jgi:hypothetical protein
MGRSPNESAIGWRRYLASMDLYSEFASHQVLAELMQAEWLRVGAEGAGERVARSDR